jgi:putative FmdB family regulatory protein
MVTASAAIAASYGAALGNAVWHSYTESAVPIYEYRCDKGHQFEVTQKMTDDPVLNCARCDAPVQRVFHPVAVHFKGKGFYNTDYGTRRRNRELERSAKDGADKTESKSTDSSSSSDKKSESKKPDAPASKSSSKKD